MKDFKVTAQVKIGEAFYLQAWTIIKAENEIDATNQFETEVKNNTATIIVLNARSVKEDK